MCVDLSTEMQYINQVNKETQVDYRNLLKKYMSLVGECEGVTFVNQTSPKHFSIFEVEELQAIDNELSEEFMHLTGGH